ncbi:DNA replication/repair protein RecF [Sandaracinobacter neustonicus]|uniref:DNA replication and repair protein RecF n=1 Tax=Sandaracinobacter neustonicus TaxID=1715348 RepID=A0A501XE84_9SPHN|nr:DNA replication/repair protein RecF [Sandaracinobacter neustonicus]
MSLELRVFRNHGHSRLAPGAAPFVLLTGPNGAGKTNVLEALSLLAVGRGLRGSPLSQMAANGGAQAGFTVLAELLPDPGLPAIAIATATRADAPERRLLKINGANAPLSALSDWSSQLWLTPAMDRLFADTASARRRFLDRLVLALSPGHAGHATRYEAAMRARTRLLTADTPADPAWLAALEAQMAEHGAALAEARATAVSALGEALAAQADGPFPRPSLALTDADQSALPDRLRHARAADKAAGRATQGPHRQDLAVTHADKAMPAALASTGEQKALLISILLAHAELVAARTGRLPLLLLDEAVAHLDPGRRAALFARLAALGGQAWLTGTDPLLFEGLEAARYTVSEGAIVTD